MKRLTIILSIMLSLMFPLVFSSESESPIIYFVDSYGIDTEYYYVYQSIYVIGHDYQKNSTYTITLIKDTVIIDEMTIPDPIPDTAKLIKSDEEGKVLITNIWNQWNTTVAEYLPVGEYILVVDVNNDGVYNERIDILDKMTIRYANGETQSQVPTFHVPEVPGGTIIAFITLLMSMILYTRKKVPLVIR